MGLGKKLFWWALFIAAVAIIIVSDLRNPPEAPTPKPTSSELKAAYPDANRFEERNDPFHYWLSLSALNQPLGAVFITTELPPDIRGYVGPVPVLVGMDRAGAIKRLVVLSNRETPYYMKRILTSGFLAKFAGRKVTEGPIKVDAVSGATITSRAITGDVNGAARFAAQRLFNIEVPQETSSAVGFVDAIILAAALLLALAARIRYRNRALKWASWIVSIAIVGIYLAIPLSFGHITDVLAGRIPPLSNLTLVVMLVWALATTVIWGPVFCGYACPFGAMQEMLWRVGRRGKWSISEQVGKRIRAFRWLVLFGLVVAVFAFGIKEAAGFEPYPYFFEELHRLILRAGAESAGGRLSVLIWLYAIFVLTISILFKRFWCRVFCPTGACLSLLSLRRRLLKSAKFSESIGSEEID